MIQIYVFMAMLVLVLILLTIEIDFGTYHPTVSKKPACITYKNAGINTNNRNNSYLNTLKNAGLVFSGFSTMERLCEIVELPNHPWFVGCQFHPEFNSTMNSPSRIFMSFVDSCIKKTGL